MCGHAAVVRFRRLRRALYVIAGLAAATPAAPAQETMDVRAFQREAARLFGHGAFTAPDAPLSLASGRALLLFQAASVLVIVCGMINRIRSDREPMEGVASMLLKVAFIATVPFWRVFLLETADAIAAAVRQAEAGDSPAVSALWDLLAQWAPPGSPALDSLEMQGADALRPASGTESGWALRAWNWASGVTAGAGSQFQQVWQAFAGGLRAVVVLGCCAAMACAVVVAVMLTHFMELLRHLWFQFGCAALPVFIAALGLPTLRGAAVKFISGVFAVACWPIGWALANLVTEGVIRAVLSWMQGLSAAAVGVNIAGNSVPPLAVCAPNLAWGVLFLCAGLTLAVCLLVFAGLFLVPLAVGRLVATGAQSAAERFHSSAEISVVRSSGNGRQCAAPAPATSSLQSSHPVAAPRVETTKEARDPRPKWLRPESARLPVRIGIRRASKMSSLP